jgi:uncharacterized protein (TIGR03086 family)
MPVSPDEAFRRGLAFFSGPVSWYAAADWGCPSPCEGWRALDVLGHVGSAVEFGTRLLAGDQPTWQPVDPPGAAVEGDPASWWVRRRVPAEDVVGRVDLTKVVDSPTGRRSIGEGLSFPAVDLFVHGWDLGAAIGRPLEVPSDAVAFARSFAERFPDDQLRNARVFGPEVEVPAEASESARFLAWTGRDPGWRSAC